jgi:hypothetical protein
MSHVILDLESAQNVQEDSKSEVGEAEVGQIVAVDWKERSCMSAYFGGESEVRVSTETEIQVGVVLFGCG